MEEVAAHKSHEAPAPKKLKQACLPFMNMLSKQAPISAKKRKRSSDSSLVVQKSPRVQRVDKCDDDPGRKVMATKVCNADNEVSSSSWNGKCDKTPKTKSSAGPLDNYMKTTQQREVSTSVVDDEGVIDLTDSNVDCAVKSGKNACNNNDVCEDITMVEVNTREEDKENVVTNDVSTCEKDCRTKTDCEIRETDSDNEAGSENEAEADNEAGSENEAESDNEAEEASASKEKKGDKPSSAEDVICEGTSSTEVASPEERSDSPSIDVDESLARNEVTPKKLDCAKNCATPTSSSIIQSTPSPCPSSSGTGFTTPVSSTKFKTPKSSSRKRSAETLKKQQEKDQEKLEKQRQRQEQKAEKEQQKADKDKQRSEEKERKLKVRLEKEMEVKEQKDKKGKERDEKLKQKEEERKQKEEERKMKDDERKKKHDIIDEEKKKKEDDKKKKEEEKQKIDEDKNRKKQKESIQNFFTKKKTTSPPKVEAKKGLFMAFEVKKEMKLAPVNRATLDGESRVTLDTLLETQDHVHTFLEECKTRPRLSTPQTWPSNDKEVEIIEADCGTTRLEPMKVKLLQFCENYRPAYYGTWGKKSAYICPRNPLKKDKDLLDYEVDSDEEWEEEEPGESLSHSEGEDGGDDAADNDSEDEDGFFVPHGYLSEGEGCEDAEEDMSIEKRKAVQLARTKKWEMDRTKKCETLKRMCIGVSWWSPDATTGEDPMQMVLAKFHAVLLVPTPIAVVRSVSEKKDQDRVAAKKGAVIRSVPEAALPHLARLVHGNVCSIQKVIKEFREYWCRHTAADSDASTTERDGDASTTDKPTDVSVIKKHSVDSVANCSVDVSISDADGDVSMIDNDGDTSVIDKDGDVSMADKDGDTSITEKNGDVSIAEKDDDTSIAEKVGDMSVTHKDGDSSMVHEDGDTSLMKNKDGDVTSESLSGIKTEGCYTFSKRQLDKTIRKLAVYERRPQYRRCCWYVHQSVLEKYGLTELPIPTQWHWLTRPNVSPKKKKVVAPRIRGSSTPVRSNTPTIKQFAVPNMKLTVNPIRKRPQFAAMNVGSESPIVIDDGVCLSSTVSPSGEVVSDVLVPRATVICEDSNSLVLHFSESESGITDDRSNDAITSKASFPKFTDQSNRRKSSGNTPGNKGKGKDKARRVMPTLLSMFGSQTKTVATTNSTTKQSTTSNLPPLPGSDSAPIEID